MKILAIENEISGKTAEDFHHHSEAEARKVWELYKKGIIREMYFRADQTSAVLILECENIEAAKEELSSLPLVLNGLISFDLLPLAPYPGLERLFKVTPGY